jgi:leader peptidase (prepilin peptidase)/N-methyltransferase
MSTAASSVRAAIARWELPTAVVLATVAVVAAGLEPRVLPLLYLSAVTPRLCAIDFAHRRLPNRIVLPGYLVAVAGAAAQWAVTGEAPILALASGSAFFVFMLAFAVAGGMGLGDVKLAGVLGMSAGLLGLSAAVISPLAAFLLGGVAAIVALRGGAGASIPFGPYLLAGFWIAVAPA